MRQRDSRSLSPRRERSKSEPQDTSRRDREDSTHEEISDEHLCPICHLLTYNPVTTRCNHTLCSTCFSHWADVSMTSQMTILPPSSSASMLEGEDTEARCPMCRTPTSATPNPSLETQLQTKYPTSYPKRAEEEETCNNDQNAETIETLTLCIGNTHKLIASPSPDEPSNMHLWKFFVRPSRTDIVAAVEIQLHPTFRPSHLRLTHAPFEVERKGWGYFVVTAFVVLKRGWSWVSEDAVEVEFRGDGTYMRKQMARVYNSIFRVLSQSSEPRLRDIVFGVGNLLILLDNRCES
jgi:hypothetical protein